MPAEPPPPPNEAVGRVLDLLARQMQGATELNEMREARDSLMEKEFAAMEGVKLRSLTVQGPSPVEVEVVEAANVSTSDTVLLIVHGGMFVTGSPRGIRHLAARLSQELGVPVATPKLRLAPEHRCPAAFEDLRTAYAYIAAHGVSEPLAAVEGEAGGAAAHGRSPKQLAIFAESSGCALTLSLVHRLLAGAGAPPQAMVMVSPWLDLTCSGGSFYINQGCDLVMQQGKLLSLAKTFLGGIYDAKDPDISPILAPKEAFAHMPPTLVHVGENEVVLDDAQRLKWMCESVELREFKDVLHAWHVFYPMMPQAELAVAEAAAFLRHQLQLHAAPTHDAALPTVAE